jgi:hypothetical protein
LRDFTLELLKKLRSPLSQPVGTTIGLEHGEQSTNTSCKADISFSGILLRKVVLVLPREIILNNSAADDHIAQ